MTYVGGGIVVEMAAVERLRVDPPLPIGERDQRHRGIGTDQLGEVRRGHLNADIGALPDAQQVDALVPHDGGTPHHVPQAALVQYSDVLRTVLCQKALLPTQPGPHALFDFVATRDPREQGARVVLRLQQAGNDALLVSPQGDSNRIHLGAALEPVRMLHLRIPIDPPPQPQQHPTRTEDLVAGVGEGVLRYPDARLDTCHLRAIARDLARQGFLGEPGRLPVMLQHLAEHSGRRSRRSPRGIASVHESPFVTVGKCHTLSVVTTQPAEQR